LKGPGNGYLSLLTPAANESGILFGNPNSNTDGGIIFNSGGSAGLQFRTGTNSTKMTITDDGNVGIGTTIPDFPLVIRGVSASSDWLTFRTPGDVNKWQLNGYSNGLNFAQSSWRMRDCSSLATAMLASEPSIRPTDCMSSAACQPRLS
jgi:hypothetical protein